MKKTVLLIAFTLSTGMAGAQEIKSDSIKPVAEKTRLKGTQSVPEYPGGLKAFYDLIVPKIQRSMRYKPGRMLVTFIIEQDGSLTDIKTVQGIDDKFDERVREIIAKSPKWKPGMQSNKPVRVQYNLPLTFN